MSILLTLFIVAWLTERLLNAIIILSAYTATRWLFPLTYHAKTSKGCLAFTICCFIIAVVLCLPIKISIIASVFIGIAISAFWFLLQYVIELKQKLPSTDEDELVQKCKSLNYGVLKTEIAVKFFINKAKPKEVWEWLCDEKHEYIEWDSVNKMKYRMKKDLFNN